MDIGLRGFIILLAALRAAKGSLQLLGDAHWVQERNVHRHLIEEKVVDLVSAKSCIMPSNQ